MTKPPSKLTGKPLGMPTCQFCGEHGTLSSPGGQFVQYGVRHYAHAVCYLLAVKSIADLTPQQRSTFTHGRRARVRPAHLGQARPQRAGR
jgi:hypothetical protein